MADRARPDRDSFEERIRLLTATYRSLHERYREIERLSETERGILADRGEIAEVNGILRRKREILREIRIEEERVMGAREWWKKIRKTLAPERSRDLLSLLDAISRRVERILALEAECRELLTRSVAWGAGSVPRTGAAATATAAVAYGRIPDPATPAPAGSPRGLR